MPQYNGSALKLGIVATALWGAVGCTTPQYGQRQIIAAAAPESTAMAATPMADEPIGTITAATDQPAQRPADSAADTGVNLQPDAPLRYVVQRGDTLWSISQRYLIEPWQWPQIWYVNDQVANPHLIYPGDVLTLVWHQNRPAVVRAAEALPTEHWSPKLRESALEAAVPTIPLDAIRDFLRRIRVASADEIKRAPYVLGFADPHLIEGAGAQIYVRGLGDAAHGEFEAVHIGEQYLDPDSGKSLGWAVIPAANVALLAHGDPATAYISRSEREVRAGDRLLPAQPDRYTAHFYPRPAPAALSARILSVFEGNTHIGQYQVIALNLGQPDGLEAGHVFNVMQSGRHTRDPLTGKAVQLPELYAGQAMVFKVESQVSFALVLHAQREMHRLDRLRSPVAGAP